MARLTGSVRHEQRRVVLPMKRKGPEKRHAGPTEAVLRTQRAGGRPVTPRSRSPASVLVRTDSCGSSGWRVLSWPRCHLPGHLCHSEAPSELLPRPPQASQQGLCRRPTWPDLAAGAVHATLCARPPGHSRSSRPEGAVQPGVGHTVELERPRQAGAQGTQGLRDPTARRPPTGTHRTP